MNNYDKKVFNNLKSIKILVNKKNKLPKNYIPNDLELVNCKYSSKEIYLRKRAKRYFELMCKKAKKNNLNIIGVSGYRSYEYQDKLYNNYIKEKGYQYASLCSAKAGCSEHQTGLAIDVSDISLDYDNFDQTKEFTWTLENSHKYGFILRYPKNKTNITGFKYEPWHYRYIGKKIAKYIYQNNITLEEYKELIK